MPFAERHLTAPAMIDMAGRKLKRYHVTVTGSEIELPIQDAAYEFLPKLLPDLDETEPAGFVVLHRGRDATFLNAYTWVWGNVVECRTAAAGEPVLGCPDRDPMHFTVLAKPWIGCVWELAPLCHERSAWVRHVLSPDQPDLAGYLGDLLPEGLIGGARE